MVLEYHWFKLLKMKSIFLFCAIALFSTSCMTIYGVHDPAKLNTIEIEKENSRLDITSSKVMSDMYPKSFDSLSISTKDALIQPLQIWIVKGDDILYSKLNCNAGGFPNLKWNITKEVINKKERPLNEQEVLEVFKSNNFISKETDVSTVLVFYSLFMGRQNRRFLKECKDFLKANPEMKSRFVNIDNIY